MTSKKKEEINEELSSMIFSKIIITVIIVFFYFLFFMLTNYDATTNKVIAILVNLNAGVLNFNLNSFKIINRFEKEAIGYIIQGVFLLILLGINHFYGSENIIYYSITLLTARVIYMLYGFFVFRKGFLKRVTFD